MDAASGRDDPLAVLFLKRLRHLLELDRADQAAGIGERERLLVHKAIFSTWLDCQDLGVSAEADWVLRGRGRLAGPAAAAA
jgi:hypothetical protein